MNEYSNNFKQYMCYACVRYFLHKGDSKYTGSCDLNRMIIFTKNHLIEITFKISD